MTNISDLIKKILIGCLVAFFLLFIGASIFNRFFSPYQTDVIVESRHENSVSIEGIVSRNEKIISYDHQGYILHYLLNDGDKVEAGGTVAELYVSESDVLKHERIKELNKNLLLLEESQEQSNELVVNAEQITLQINDKLKALSRAVYSKDSELINDCKNDLFVMFNRRNIITKKETNYDAQIEKIKKEISDINKTIKTSVKSVNSAENGNFVVDVDGYENVASYDKILKMSTDELEDLIANDKSETVSEKAVGKIIKDFSWQYTTVLPIDDSTKYNEKIKLNSTYKMRFKELSEDTFPVTVKNIVEDEQNKKLIVTFESDILSKNFCDIRKQKAELILSTSKGYKINKSAIRIIDGKKGVFVVVGQKLSFRTINILYDDKTFVICEPDGVSGTIRPYDDVVVKGTDLYDGKTIK